MLSRRVDTHRDHVNHLRIEFLLNCNYDKPSSYDNQQLVWSESVSAGTRSLSAARAPATDSEPVGPTHTHAATPSLMIDLIVFSFC